MTDTAAAYIEILKYDENDDGTLTVYGKATDDTLDSDQQICDPEWLDKAMPEWFKYGNIREQHSNIAAGVATEYERKEDGHYIGVKVVDPNSCKKVKNRVLKGFSVGIRGPRVVKDSKAAGGRIVDGTIVEVSLVDRPANPACMLSLAKTEGSELVQVEELVEKREFTADEREQAAEEGWALPDGSYPIKTVEDLRNAVQAFGRAKDPAKVKKHIIERARALDAVEELPEDWNVKKMTAVEIVKQAAGFATDLTKFDQAAFDAARQALATLIQVEAGELAEGEDETHSLSCLLLAVHALFEWHEGEAAAGETTAIPELEEEEEAIELADAPSTDGCDCDGCKECAAAGGCDEKMCKGHHEAKSDSVKCLECGCHQPADNHGRDDVTTAEVVTNPLTVDEVKSLVADTIAQLLPTTVTGGEDLTKAADAERIEALESELAQVKALAAPSGPRRMAAVSSTNSPVSQAATFRAKAAATEDAELRKGYLALAAELETNK